jgi:parallel beta-helix repeat protein
MKNNVGIILFGGKNNTISHNIILKCDEAIELSGTIQNKFFNNIIDQAVYGFSIWGFSKYNLIISNNISNCKYKGIEIWDNSFYNIIYRNNFWNNSGANNEYNEYHIQVYDEAGMNIWNASTEGNYWSDWTSPDNNGDGFIDQPYLISKVHNYFDNHPFAEPINNVETKISEYSPLPLIICSVLLLTAIVARGRRGYSRSL